MKTNIVVINNIIYNLVDNYASIIGIANECCNELTFVPNIYVDGKTYYVIEEFNYSILSKCYNLERIITECGCKHLHAYDGILYIQKYGGNYELKCVPRCYPHKFIILPFGCRYIPSYSFIQTNIKVLYLNELVYINIPEQIKYIVYNYNLIINNKKGLLTVY